MFEKVESNFVVFSEEQALSKRKLESERPVDFAEAPILNDEIHSDSDIGKEVDSERPTDAGPVLGDKKEEISSKVENDNVEGTLENTIEDYFSDLQDKSEHPETIPERPFESSDLEKLSPQEVAERRDEFDDKKTELKRQWEIENGVPWPKYEKDVYSSNDKLIRKAGSDYDAHHIQPLAMGGKNVAGNITPLSAEVHYDKQGIHAPDSPYSKMDKLLGGIES